MKKLTRRNFLKLAGAALAGTILTGQGCAPKPEEPLPTAVVPATNTSPPPIPTVTLAPKAIRRPEIIQFYPSRPSKIAWTHHAQAWDKRNLVPAALSVMLAASITRLTGLEDATQAWQALFAPGEKIAIKVNTIQHSNVKTHVPLVMAVAEALQSAGVPAEQIFIYDRNIEELKSAGFTLNFDYGNPGVRCFGTDNYKTGWFWLSRRCGFIT